MTHGIIRVKRTPGDFFQAYKPPFQNNELSFAARGLLVYLCTKPDDWRVRNSDLVNASPGGKAALQTILKELRDAGHIQRIAKKDTQGNFVGWDTLVYENPADNPEFNKEDTTDIPISGKTDNRKDRKMERPKTGERKELIMNLTNNKPLSIKGDEPKKPTPADIEYYNPLSQELIKLCELSIPLVNGTKLDFMGVIKFFNAKQGRRDRIKEFGQWYGQTPTLKAITDNWGRFEAGELPPHRQYKQNGANHNGHKPGNQKTNGKTYRTGADLAEEPYYDPATNEHVFPNGRREPVGAA